MGVVEGDALRCCYHAWAYRGNGRISQIPYLPKGVARPPRGVRAYPVREAYGLVFVFPGDPAKAATAAARAARVRLAPAQDDDVLAHRALPLLVHAREPARHEPPVPAPGHPRPDPPQLLGYDSGPQSVEARYLFTHGGGKNNRGASLLAGEGIGGSNARRRHHPHRVPVPDPPAGPGERRPPRVLPLGRLRARGRRAAHQPRLRPAHDREAAGARRAAPRLAAHPAVHRAGVRRGPDGGRGRAAGLGRAGRGPQPRGVPADPRRPRRAAQQRRADPPGSALCGAASFCGAAAGRCRLR